MCSVGTNPIRNVKRRYTAQRRHGATPTRLRNVQRRGQTDTKCQTKIHSATKTAIGVLKLIRNMRLPAAHLRRKHVIASLWKNQALRFVVIEAKACFMQVKDAIEVDACADVGNTKLRRVFEENTWRKNAVVPSKSMIKVATAWRTTMENHEKRTLCGSK